MEYNEIDRRKTAKGEMIMKGLVAIIVLFIIYSSVVWVLKIYVFNRICGFVVKKISQIWRKHHKTQVIPVKSVSYGNISNWDNEYDYNCNDDYDRNDSCSFWTDSTNNDNEDSGIWCDNDADMYACTDVWRNLHPYDYNPCTGGCSADEDHANGW